MPEGMVPALLALRRLTCLELLAGNLAQGAACQQLEQLSSLKYLVLNTMGQQHAAGIPLDIVAPAPAAFPSGMVFYHAESRGGLVQVRAFLPNAQMPSMIAHGWR